MAIIRPSNQQTVMPQGSGAYLPGGAPPIEAFGNISGAVAADRQGRDLQVAGQQIERASDAAATVALLQAKEMNDTRVQDLNNQFIAGQQKVLYTAPDAFYRQKGEGAIRAAEPTTNALLELKKNLLDQAGNTYQRKALSEKLDFHLNSATDGISRHVATQASVWQDAVAKGTVLNAQNEAALNFNDPEKVRINAEGAYTTEYDRVLKETGSPEAAKASATAAGSKVWRDVISLQAVDNPNQAKATLEANRARIDAGDAVMLEAKIKAATLHRQTQNITAMVTATGGVSPNYPQKVGGAENGGSYQGENKIGALGKYQMIPSTYTGLAQETEWGKGKTQAEVRALLLDPKDGPARQDELQKGLQGKQTQALTDKGVPVNDLTLYTTHFLGTGAGPAILKLPDSTPLQAGLMIAHGGDKAFVQKVNDANPFPAKVQTVGDFKALMAQKIGAPQTLAVTGSPEKPNLDAMLAAGLALAGDNPDLRDSVSNAIKADFSTKLAIYNAQKTDLEKQAYLHIDSGGTLENLPPQIRGGLDAEGLGKVAIYEEKRLEKKRKANADEAGRGLADLERLNQLTEDDVVRQRNNLPEKEYRSWLKTARGNERTDDSDAYERLQRGLGTRDMRDDIFAAHGSGDISSQTRNSFLEKNALFLQQGAPATPYKIGHDYVMRSLDPGLMGSGISREIAGRAIKEYDQYVAANPMREGETPEAFAKRLDTFSQDTVRRYSLINTQDLAVSQPVPVHTPFNRADMTTLAKPEATRKIAAANAELSKKFADGQITEDQYNLDAIALMGWLNFVQKRPETPAAKK